ncbi:DUF6239 family natural product biosynthesis protein [Geodermatophilus maliterrae]|uniref:DUF6239 family natural product biosynthesis protein n=1 Tax=Geodermatophilus maliterrae TaxID=3162531 RepID=A0ABV3XC21_9ACTN
MQLRDVGASARRPGRGRLTQVHHHHDTSLGWSLGAGWLHVLLVAAVLVLAASALARPFLGSPGRRSRAALTVVAAGAVVALLVLSDGVDGPRQLVALAVLVAVLPVLVAARQGTALARGARRAAPWVVAAASTVTVVEVARARLGAPGPVLEARLVDSALLAAVVGLSWLSLCRAPSWRVGRSRGVLAWALGCAVLIGTATATVTGTAI